MVRFKGQASPICKAKGIQKLHMVKDRVDLVAQAVLATPLSDCMVYVSVSNDCWIWRNLDILYSQVSTILNSIVRELSTKL